MTRYLISFILIATIGALGGSNFDTTSESIMTSSAEQIEASVISTEVTTVDKETKLGEIDIPWYEISPYDNLPKGSSAEELFGIHHFSTENDFEYIPPSVEEMNGNAPKELISSHYDVSLPNNLHHEFVDIIAWIDDDIYVNVTDLIEWSVEDDTVAYVYDGRIMANGKGSTAVTASFSGFEISIDVVVEAMEEFEV